MIIRYVTNKYKKKKAKNSFTAQNVVFMLYNIVFTDIYLYP